MVRMILAGGALLAALTADVFAQAEKIDDPHDPGRTGVTREQYGSAATRTDQPRQPAIADDDLAATSALTKIGEEARPDLEQPPNTGPEPAPLRTTPPASVQGTRGGGVLEANDVYANHLTEMTVEVGNRGTIGNVSNILIDIDAGQIAALLVSNGGGRDLSDQSYRVPWQDIRSIDKNAERIRTDRQPEPAGNDAVMATDPKGHRLVTLDALSGMSVTVGHAENFGQVARLVIDQSSGAVEQLTISTGGALGIGLSDVRYDIPWNAVAAVDLQARRVLVDRTPEDLKSLPAFADVQ
jgi:sporulation protein YlmC with PRC-barrel domain